jgi:hypothetical protein
VCFGGGRIEGCDGCASVFAPPPPRHDSRDKALPSSATRTARHHLQEAECGEPRKPWASRRAEAGPGGELGRPELPLGALRAVETSSGGSSSV